MLSFIQMKLPKKIPSFLFPLLFFISLFVNLFLLKDKINPLNKEEGILVIGVIDGDTIVLDGKVRLRLRGLDAPELNYCLGEESKIALEKLVTDKKVIVKEQIIDQMNRPMALIYVGDKFINREMLKLGLARFHSDNHSKKEDLKIAYDESRLKSLGIYSSQCRQSVNPDNPKCNIKGNIDKSTDTHIYYVPGCVQYKTAIVEKDLGESWFCTENEALTAGYSKSSRCP